MDMFCYQCEQTARGAGCTVAGVCGKSPEVAALQDLLVYAVMGIAQVAHRARQRGMRDRDIDVFTLEALFSTVTNVNFDADRMDAQLRKAVEIQARAERLYDAACRKAGVEPEVLAGPARWRPAADRAGLLADAPRIGIAARRQAFGPDVAGLQDLVLYGLKGMAAYADHAMILGREDESVYAFFHEALDALAAEAPSAEAFTALALRTGEVNLKVMAMLDAAHTGTFGHPEPTRVRVEPVRGQSILVSGHDLKDLRALLEQTVGTGINVYTHGEMLPAHAYPGLKQYAHLAGNYGGAWQDQKTDFDRFPGAILMTTNCLQRPLDSYRDRLFTTGLVAWPGVTHVAARDFGPVIQAARRAEGFPADGPDRRILVGFGHHAALGAAGRIAEAVRAGRIRRFFLIGGCDGAKPGRNYYTEFAEAVPPDGVILTLACGKYRFNKKDFGTIDGIPRLLDVGQCNDAYSAIRIAGALAAAFGTDVNGLPLSFILSWYEQKAVCILLTLLHLGIRNIRIGPSLPAFVTPAVLGVLVKSFNVMPITTVQEDLAEALAGR
jgi:hydroxylamine reductase